MIPQQKKRAFQKKILDWYTVNKRDLPWRMTRDPYLILISEIMSQQTQLPRVIPKYIVWIEKFPTIKSLAYATLSDVLRYWNGLGYNRRAIYLKKTAEIIVEKNDGKFPEKENELRLLPGIGKYTARAVLCFAFDHQISVVDTNVRKVILTQFIKKDEVSKNEIGKITEQFIEKVAEELLPPKRAYEWNQALMDFAASVLKNEKIPIPKQSKFFGSHRYFRGQILKQLLQKNNLTVSELGPLLKKDYDEHEVEWLQNILEEMVREGFLVNKNNIYNLSA